MSIRDQYFPGSTVSRYLQTGEHSWGEAVYQSGKPVLDAELILSQDITREIRKLLLERETPSGWLRGPIPFEATDDFTTGTDPNTFNVRKRVALVAGLPVIVEYTGTVTAGTNVVTLDAPPEFGGAPPDVKRTDFVFLEVFRCVVSHSPRASATVTVVTNADIVAGDLVTINGVNLTAVAGAPGVDEFQIGANEAATATNIATALSDVANSFELITSAQVDITTVEQVNLRAADAFAGAAGNAITLTVTLVNAGAITVSGATFAGGSDTSNKPTQATLYRHGNVDAPAGVNLTDDIADPTIGTESTKRIQTQYRIRVTGQAEAVNFKTEDGFTNANVLAQGTQAAPVADYPFVPADNTTVSLNSDATAYQTIDQGLWIAGDGSETAATDLGTVDGLVYAIPLCFVFRRTDAYGVGGGGSGFDPLNNTNGALPQTHGAFVNPIIGAIGANRSDRPDGRFNDEILPEDILDLRKQVVPGGMDLKAELDRQMKALLDGNLLTWAIDAADKNTLGAGSGDVAAQLLVCNEIGRSAA